MTDAAKVAVEILKTLPRSVMMDTWIKNEPAVASIIQEVLDEQNAEIELSGQLTKAAMSREREANRDWSTAAKKWFTERKDKDKTIADRAAIIRELLSAMRDYEMHVDCDPPSRHREMMQRAEVIISKESKYGRN